MKLSMSQTPVPSLSNISETLLIPLYLRAIETQRPDPLIRDEKAVELARALGPDFARLDQAQVGEEVGVALVLRNREFDRHVKEYLARWPQAVVVSMGCGLDARFERVDNGQVEWYDLDLPEVIDLREKLIGGEGPRYHLLACSALERAWLDIVSVHRPRPFLFLAEGVLMFLKDAQVKQLVLTLKERFPGAELVLDAFSPFFAWGNNRRVARTGVGALCHWALRHAQDLEKWGEGIRLLDEWFPFSSAEPRLGRARWVRHIPLLAKATGVFRYRLGNPAREWAVSSGR